jgi:hypothetical protein
VRGATVETINVVLLIIPIGLVAWSILALSIFSDMPADQKEFFEESFFPKHGGRETILAAACLLTLIDIAIFGRWSAVLVNVVWLGALFFYVEFLQTRYTSNNSPEKKDVREVHRQIDSVQEDANKLSRYISEINYPYPSNGHRVLDEIVSKLATEGITAPPGEYRDVFIDMINQFYQQQPEFGGFRTMSLGITGEESDFDVKFKLMRHTERLKLLSGDCKKTVAVFDGPFEILIRDYLERGKADSSAFAVPLHDALPSAGGSVMRDTSLFSQPGPYQFALFQAFRETYHANIVRVSGAFLSQRDIEKHSLVIPRQFPGKASELVDGYLVGTPLLRMYKMQVPFDFQNSRFKHQWVVSPSGGGKTTLLETQIAYDISSVEKGKCSIIVIDSQNTLIPKIAGLKCFASGQPLHDKLVWLEPDPDYPLALNLFDMGMENARGRTTREREMLQASAMELVQFCLSSMSDQQGELFNYVVQLVMVVPGATIDTLRELLEPKGLEKFEQYLPLVDETVQAFFRSIYEGAGFKVTREAVLRRVMGMMGNQTFRKMFKNRTNKFNMMQELSEAKVILINTDLAYLKADGCRLFGRFFVAQLLQAAEMRGEGLPVYCYIDEMHDYLANDENLAMLLDKARKRNIGMILAHQRLSQITSANVLDALSNVDIQIAGGNRTDATKLAGLMKTTPEEISDQLVGSFMCFVKGRTQHAVQIRVPEVMKHMPRMTKSELERVRRTMQNKYAGSGDMPAPVNENIPPVVDRGDGASSPKGRKPRVPKENSPYGDVV